MSGRASGGAIVCTPPPVMLKLIVSNPALALAPMIAARREPAVGVTLLPLSTTVVTVNGAGMERSSR